MKSDFEEIYPLSQKISRYVGKAIRDYNMVRPDDKILIGISGGKDSLLLALSLSILKKRSPISFELEGCLVDQSGGTMDTSKIAEYLDILGIPLKIITHNTYEIMKLRDERSPCSLCANMRRGILATYANEINCNATALGHHKDDAVETVLLNMLYGGRFKCFHPHLFMTKTKVRVIRPFIYLEEYKIMLEAKRLNLPVLSSCCPYGDKSKRKSVKELSEYISSINPEFKSNVIHSLRNLKENESWIAEVLNE